MHGRSKLEILVEGSNAPLKDMKTKGDGQAEFIYALNDQKPPGRGHASPTGENPTVRCNLGKSRPL